MDGWGDTGNSPQLAGINKMQGPSHKITEHDAAEPKGVARGKDKGQNSYRREQTVTVGSSIAGRRGKMLSPTIQERGSTVFPRFLSPHPSFLFTAQPSPFLPFSPFLPIPPLPTLPFFSPPSCPPLHFSLPSSFLPSILHLSPPFLSPPS